MNILHSSKNDGWQTPAYILDAVHEVLGDIDLDPASTECADINVCAKRFITKEENGLYARWQEIGGEPITIFINPPGGKLLNKSMSGLFWDRLMDYSDQGLVKHAIFLAFSIEALQTTQVNSRRSISHYPFCVPRTRLKFLDPTDGRRVSPTHGQAIVYVPGTVDDTNLFVTVFSKIGVCSQHLAPRQELIGCAAWD